MVLYKKIIILAFACSLAACSQQEPKGKIVLSPEAAFDSLIAYIEQTGDFINSPNVPAMISAAEVYNLLDSNILVIDTRNADEFSAAHIANSMNIPFAQLLNFIETKIDPNGFSKIIIVCNAGQTASYATSLLRLLGYNNVYALRFGFCSWHKPSAEIRWLARLSSKYSEMLELSTNIKNKYGIFPIIETEKGSGYEILRERVQLLFSQDFNSVTISADSLFDPNHKFYIINYWPEDIYSKGHIPGAIQYTPRESLKRSQQLNTLPTDRPIAVYCFNGQHSSFVTAYLRLLGYDARTLPYGTNGFMYGKMQKEGIGNIFTENDVLDLPVVSGGFSEKPKDAVKVEVKPRGGC